jgi:acetyl-CoA carboxylase carboxyl transferase subunit beta
MASVVGEKLTRAMQRGLQDRFPVIVISASGGARMMEGILSLMQMAKTSVLLARLREARVPFVSILTDPTTGGVTASFASLGDFIFAEPGALIGFAGPRVIRETVAQELPEGFQRSEFLLEHGFVDRIVDRRELKDTIVQVLGMLGDARREAVGRGAPYVGTQFRETGGNGGPALDGTGGRPAIQAESPPPAAEGAPAVPRSGAEVDRG